MRYTRCVHAGHFSQYYCTNYKKRALHRGQSVQSPPPRARRAAARRLHPVHPSRLDPRGVRRPARARHRQPERRARRVCHQRCQGDTKNKGAGAPASADGVGSWKTAQIRDSHRLEDCERNQWSISHMPQLHFCALSGLSRMNESSAPPQTQGHTRTPSDCDTLVSLLRSLIPLRTGRAFLQKCLPARSTVNGTPSTFISGRRRLHWGQIGGPRPVDAPVQP